MRISELLAKVRRKVDETVAANSKWTDAEIVQTINTIHRRLHRKLEASNPDLFRMAVDVVLPADTEEVPLPWNRPGPPRLISAKDITDDVNYPDHAVLVPLYMEQHVDGVGIRGKVFYTTQKYGAAKTFRLWLSETAKDLAYRTASGVVVEDGEFDDIPEDYQEDLFVYGAAIELQEELPNALPDAWREKYKTAEDDLLKFMRNQMRGMMGRYGEAHALERMGTSYVGYR